MLPRVAGNSEVLAETDAFGGAIPIAGSAGDQQAALFGQACFLSGQGKNTYGTGCFLLVNTGPTPQRSDAGLLTTVGWRIGGTTTYALEGSAFVTGAAVQWLRDGLGIIAESAAVQPLAASVPDSGGVVFVPALTGLGAPDWDPLARGALFGITRGTTAAHIARATLEAIAHQTRDVLDAMVADSGFPMTELRVDGGAARDDLLLQIQADLLGVPVIRPRNVETTALGAAYLAGLAAGVWPSQTDIAARWRVDRVFEPAITRDERDTRHARWRRAVARSLAWAE
jgi:glycerol kinase